MRKISASDSRIPIAKIILVGLVIASLIAAYQLGLFGLIADKNQAKQTFLNLGPWSYVSFIAAFAILQPFGAPGTMFIIIASLIWPWPIAFAVSMAGAMTATTIGFSFARFIARDWVSNRLPTRFQSYEKFLEKRGFVTIAGLRFFLLTHPALHAFLGISNVRFWVHFWASFIGYCLPVLFISFFSDKAFEILKVWIH